ncbi:hypothetical protein [Aquimarina sp. 2201CG5-10]|uniref:hypothetical protein n=1 Tax=Aquimarina callyspongiae TaxID=3098150 RepID=UPI002AB4CD02|nr:hypothetical protein [Aquimarina sp. 2201CG5-10]MDY8138716.1 hypothetical protein [Aquimarina sp. 2201CG5-10]
MSKLLTSSVDASVDLPDLPIIDWNKIGASAPEHLWVDYQGPQAKLPDADIVVITWTVAEWSALDHVFVNSDTTRNSKAYKWRDDWFLYSRNAPSTTNPSEKEAYEYLWGYFRMVKITNKDGEDLKVLLFKSESHLSHPPYITGLSDMVKNIIDDSQPDKVYSIGTAGGARLDECLGDVAVTNMAKIELDKPQNKGVDYNNETFSCKTWFPNTDLLPQTQDSLFFTMTDAVSDQELQNLLDQLQEKTPDAKDFTLQDLVNRPINPKNLGQSRALPFKDTPLLTTDFYFIADETNATQYCVLEMDDAVIAHQAGLQDTDYAFVRNISDPLVPTKTADGRTIPEDVRTGWSGMIYQTFGIYSSFNGALTTWATIAG